MNLATYLSENNVTQSELARLLGISPVLIHQWKSGERKVPAQRCPAIERVTKGAVRCEDLRPDVDWGYLRNPISEDAGDIAPEQEPA